MKEHNQKQQNCLGEGDLKGEDFKLLLVNHLIKY